MLPYLPAHFTQEYGSDTESDLEWTPALSEYESATEDDDSFQEDLDGTPVRLHTNSPAWASLFPLPDSPDITCHALPYSNEFCNVGFIHRRSSNCTDFFAR